MTCSVLCVQDGRDGAVAAAEPGRRGAGGRGPAGHHEGLPGKSVVIQPGWRDICVIYIVVFPPHSDTASFCLSRSSAECYFAVM